MDENVEGETLESQMQSAVSVEGYPHGIVVAGEASESDEEFVDINLPVPLKTDIETFSPLTVDKPVVKPGTATTRVKSSKAYTLKNPRFNSLLHQKLREKNEELDRCLRDFLTNAYASSARRLFTVCNNLSKSESALQDASNNMRLQTNDLFHLEDKLDIITSCHLLPDINV